MIDFKSINEKIYDGSGSLSISGVLGLISKPFDQRGVAEKTYNKHFNNPDSQYYQKSIEEIMKMWSDKGAESCRYGSMLDDYIGLNITNADTTDIKLWKLDNDYLGDERLKGVCDSFDNFYKYINDNTDLEFVDREKTVYYKTPNGYIKGRFDALFRDNSRNKWIIIDWKSSNTVDKENRWEKLLGPAKALDACNGNTYTIQGYFYKTALVESYLPEGTTYDDVEFRIVQLPGHILENNNNFQIHKPLFDYNKEFIDKILEFALMKNELMK